MRRLLFGSILGLIIISGVTPAVHADTLSVTGQIITITAQVDSRITVVVDGSGRISKIFSNSNSHAAPQYVSGSITGPSTMATPALNTEYQRIMNGKPISYGYIYERQSLPPIFSSLLGN